MKACRTCEEVKPLGEYYNLAKSEDGKHPDCKACCKVSRSLEAVRKRDKKNKISVRQRVRAMNLGIAYDKDVTLAKVYKKDRGICYICGKHVPPGKASMDHVHPVSKGGTHRRTPTSSGKAK